MNDRRTAAIEAVAKQRVTIWEPRSRGYFTGKLDPEDAERIVDLVADLVMDEDRLAEIITKVRQEAWPDDVENTFIARAVRAAILETGDTMTNELDHRVIIRADPDNNWNGLSAVLVCLHPGGDLGWAARADEGEGPIVDPVECWVKSHYEASDWEAVRWGDSDLLVMVPVTVEFDGSGPVLYPGAILEQETP